MRAHSHITSLPCDDVYIDGVHVIRMPAAELAAYADRHRYRPTFHSRSRFQVFNHAWWIRHRFRQHYLKRCELDVYAHLGG